MPTATMSMSAYARQRGCSPQYIAKVVKAGKVPLVDGKIDPAIADAALARQADPAREPQVRAHAERRGHALNTGGPAAPPATDDERSPTEPGRYVDTPMSRAKAADAVFSAKIKQMEYERSIGKLVESAEVARAITAIAPALTQLDGIPDRLTARVRAAPDERTARMLLADEIAACRQAVADFCRALAERLTATTQ